MSQRRWSELSQSCTTWGTQGTSPVLEPGAPIAAAQRGMSYEDQRPQRAPGQAEEVRSWEGLQDPLLTWTSALSASPVPSISAPSDQLSLPAGRTAGRPPCQLPTQPRSLRRAGGHRAGLLPGWALTRAVPAR